MVARDAALAAYEEGRIHIQHLSCVESVAAIAAAKQAGTRITAEVSPHHLLLTDEDVRELDTRRKMNPPLRAERDRQAIIEALRSGVIDCIATDHAPHHRDDKDVPFEQAAFGTTGLETAFSTLYTELVLPGVIDLDGSSAAQRGGPGARPAGAADRGRRDREPLSRRPARPVAGRRVRLREPLGGLCFAGRTVTGRALLTLADGIVAYRERAFALTAA